jgi:DNA-directed RNA polymerase sigma subunit (sigma70/sigma32)
MDREKVVEIVRQALASLTPREEKVIRLRFGITEEPDNDLNYPITHEEIAALDNRLGGV